MRSIDFGADNFRGYFDDIGSCFTVFGPALIKQTIKDGKKLSLFDFNGKLAKNKDELYALIKKHGGELWFAHKDYNQMYSFEGRGFLSFTFYKENISGDVVSVDGAMDKLASVITEEFISKDKSSSIYAVVNSSDGLTYRMIGKNEQPLIRENYSKELMEDYDKAITALKDNTGGRIVILQGPAGTGKTFQIRGMITDLDFVSLLIPASLVSELDGPAFLPLLLDINRDEKDKPILIIVEDGDDCLINRDEGNNMSAISSLLNVSDGILGSILDIKIVVSTNAEIKDIDKAILRPGRLCAHLFVDPLPYGKSMEVIRRLSKNEKFELPEKREYVLAELYAIANDKDFHSHVGKLIKKIGF